MSAEQHISAALLNAIVSGIQTGEGGTTRDLLCLFEFYEYDVLPGADGFDPADASETFAQFDFTWLGIAYRRIVTSVTDITLATDKTPNSCTVTFSNADQDRYFANWVQTAQIEGMRMVVRIISESASATLADSYVRFTGKCAEPDSISNTGQITAKAEIGDANHEFPPRLFTADDPDGRILTDPLFEGFPIVTLQGSFTMPLSEQDKRFKKSDPRRYAATKQWSSYDDTPIGEPIPFIAGRVQTDLIDIIFADMGTTTKRLDVIGMGTIEGLTNVRTIYPGDVGNFLSQPIGVTLHKGETGGTGTQIADARFPGYPLFSGTAYITFEFTGSKPDRLDRGHDTIAVVLGVQVPLPNSSGVFGSSGWTDNGAYHTRYLLTDPRFFGNDPAFIEDPACFATGTDNDAPLIDDSDGETVLIPDPDAAEAAVTIHRFRSTGHYSPPEVLYRHFGIGVRPELVEIPAGDYQTFDIESPTPALIAVEKRYARKRFTTNVILKKLVKGIDFLYDVILKSYRGYLVWNWRGKIEIRSERPADFAHLRSSLSAGATSIPVEDVTPWASSLWGRVVVGAHQTTSEVRTPSAFAYTSDANSITLTASGTSGMTATAAGGTLTGGNASTRASRTVTVGGTPGLGRTITATINGTAVTYTLTADDTVNTAAAMLATFINAHTQLRRFVSAEWSSGTPTVITIRSKWGVLTVPALANSHAGPINNPTAAATLTASAGPLAAGVYKLAYVDRTALGTTAPSPTSTITLTAGQQINVGATPAFQSGVVARDFYLSRQPNDGQLVFWGSRGNNSAFVMAALAATGEPPPEYNTTGEEVIRVAKSFASNNQTAGILSQAGLTRGNIAANTYRFGNLGQTPAFNRVVGTYVDSSDDFAESKYVLLDKALKERMGRLVTRELNLTAVDSFNHARRLVGFEFSKYIDHPKQVSFRGDATAILMEEGDTYCASSAEGGHVNALWRVEDLTLHISDRTFQATIKGRQYSTRMFDERVRKHQALIPSVLRWTAILDTEVQLMDMPHYTDEDAEKGGGIYVAVRRSSGVGDWPGANIWVDVGAGYELVASTDVEAITGVTTNTLATGTTDGIDIGSTVRVTLDRGELSAYTDDEILQGAPVYRIGSEYVRSTETPVSGATYDLTRFRRGLFGTDTQTATHSAGEAFTVMQKGAVVFIPLDNSLLGKTIKVKAQTVRQDLADAAEHTIVYTGRALQDRAPANIRGYRNVSSDILGEFDGRVRGTLRPGWRNPRGADVERYLVRIMNDAGSAEIFRYVVERGVTPSPAFWRVAQSAWGTLTTVVGSDGDVNFKTVSVTFSTGSELRQGGHVETLQTFSGEFMLKFRPHYTGGFTNQESAGRIGFILSGVDPAALTERFYFNVPADGAVRAENDAATEQTVTSTSDEFTLWVKDGKARYYKNMKTLADTPFYESPHQVEDTRYKAFAYSRPPSGLEKDFYDVRILRLDPEFIFTAAQQTQFFGGLKAAGTMRVKVQKINELVGPGQTGEGFI